MLQFSPVDAPSLECLLVVAFVRAIHHKFDRWLKVVLRIFLARRSSLYDNSVGIGLRLGLDAHNSHVAYPSEGPAMPPLLTGGKGQA